jgi:hypothetical protein
MTILIAFDTGQLNAQCPNSREYVDIFAVQFPCLRPFRVSGLNGVGMIEAFG